jgi:uncharacterized protein (DUF2237 family)
MAANEVARNTPRNGPRNVLGGALETCGKDPMTGFYRTGCCETGPDDLGVHVVCAVVTDEFLQFSKSRGNDLSTPRPGFAGLKGGDPWCLCAMRWVEAEQAGMAPPIVLAATHEATLQVASLETLLPYALDREMVGGQGKA